MGTMAAVGNRIRPNRDLDFLALYQKRSLFLLDVRCFVASLKIFCPIWAAFLYFFKHVPSLVLALSEINVVNAIFEPVTLDKDKWGNDYLE